MWKRLFKAQYILSFTFSALGVLSPCSQSPHSQLWCIYCVFMNAYDRVESCGNQCPELYYVPGNTSIEPVEIEPHWDSLHDLFENSWWEKKLNWKKWVGLPNGPLLSDDFICCKIKALLSVSCNLSLNYVPPPTPPILIHSWICIVSVGSSISIVRM